MRRRDIAIGLAASLVFADATIVTLALPNLLVDLHTTVYGVASVLGVYTAALACTALPAPLIVERLGFTRTGIGALCAFSLASLACAVAGGVPLLLVARGVQGVAGALILTVAGAALAPPRREGRSWVLVGVLSTAAGPVIGGALTQAFSWRAIFVAQIPVPLVAAALYRTWSAIPPSAHVRPWSRLRSRPLLVLGLVSGALTALLFGVVLLLVVGWAMRPLSAALAVTLVPIAAFAGSRVQGNPVTRVVVGCALIAGGIGALAFLPTNDVVWLFAPECIAGVGMGLTLTPLLEDLLSERSYESRAGNLAVRYLGITLTLVALAPVIAHDLDAATERAKLRTVAVVLDAPISPGDKLSLAPKLVSAVHSDQPLAAVRSAGRNARGSIKTNERSSFDTMFNRVEDVFVAAAADAFHRAFLIAAALAFLAALVLALEARRAALVAAAGAVAVVGAQAIADHYAAPKKVTIANPCRPRQVPNTGGLGGAAQTAVLRALDAAACRLGASREELVLALADKKEADKFERRHGFNPRSLLGILHLITGQ